MICYSIVFSNVLLSILNFKFSVLTVLSLSDVDELFNQH